MYLQSTYPKCKCFLSKCLLGCFVLLTQTKVIAQDNAAEARAKTEPYYRDAQSCKSKNPSKASEGLSITEASIDETGYLMCMEDLGYQQEARTDPLLKALEKCQRGVPNVSARGVTTMRAPTVPVFRDCMKSRGFDLAIATQSGKRGSNNSSSSQSPPALEPSRPENNGSGMRTILIPGDELSNPQ